MTDRQHYSPGPATGAQVRSDGEKRTLVLVRELRHPREKVWQALTDPAHLHEWAPFDADASLATPGATVKLTTVGAPTPHITETTITRADAPNILEYNWGGFAMRWELESMGDGTRLTLWTNIGPRYIAMGAAGWHICFDILAHLLDNDPLQPHRRPRRHKIRRLATPQRRILQAIRHRPTRLAALHNAKIINRKSTKRRQSFSKTDLDFGFDLDFNRGCPMFVPPGFSGWRTWGSSYLSLRFIRQSNTRLHFFAGDCLSLAANIFPTGIITDPIAPFPASRKIKRTSLAFFSSTTVSEKFSPCFSSC